MPIFTVGPSPHWRSASSITKMNYAFILALFPAAFVGAIASGMEAGGMPALAMRGGLIGTIVEVFIEEMALDPWILGMMGSMGILALGTGTGLLSEYVIQMVFRQPYHATNGHGAFMGLIMAMLMPASVPWWVLVFGVVLAILVGKQIFGGIGGYPLHPAMVGWLILLLSWQHYIYPVGYESLAAAYIKSEYYQAFIPVPIYATIFGGITLVALGHVRWQIPAGVIIGVAAGTILFQLIAPEKVEQGFIFQLFSGHVMLAAFFIATDATSSPANKIAIWIYALGIGLLIMLIRTYGQWPDAIPFAILLMNVMNPLLDRIRPRVKQVVVQNG